MKLEWQDGERERMRLSETERECADEYVKSRGESERGGLHNWWLASPREILETWLES